MSKKNKVTISFVVPVYRDADSIQKMVESVRDQDLPNIEIIAVEDFSDDDSGKILDSLKEQGLIDEVIHMEKNTGACGARNAGAKIAKGKYLSFLPADAILYPGMARKWYEALEEHPECDFAYGGYRFTDEDGEPIAGTDYFFNAFNAHLLETTNYIDGSFPIRADAFWKYAKIMNQPDGLWDSNIKSLQDWDFWLSVVRNGGKGWYMQDIFFGTTLPHAGGLSEDSSKNWIERTEAIKKKQGIPKRKMCVASLGASFHAKRVAEILDADFKEMPSFKPHKYESIYTIGFYPEFAVQQDQMYLNNLHKPDDGRTSAKKIIHFVGSDIWQLQDCSQRSMKLYHNYFKNNIDEILCEADFTQKELKDLGIDAKIVPIPPGKLFDVKPLPKDFTVACYLPMVNAAFYQPEKMIDLAKKMPDIKFKFFGNPKQVGIYNDLPPNIEFMGYVENMEKFISECSAIMRFPIHDGLPISVVEFILAGRYAMLNVSMNHTYHLPEFNVEMAMNGIKFMKDKAEKEGVNQLGSDFWREEMDHAKYKKTLEDLAEYKPQEYWDKYALGWILQSPDMKLELDEIKQVFDKVPHDSVLDLGSGDSKWYPILKGWGMKDYIGIDISKTLVEHAKVLHPEIKDNLFTSKVEEYEPKEKVDLVFAYTCLEHIKEEDWDKAVANIKKMGSKLLLVEPMDFESHIYCRNHNYRDSFVVETEIKLKDKVILLCNLKS